MAIQAESSPWPVMRYTFSMADRVAHSQDLFWEIIEAVRAFEYPAPCHLEFRLCREGMRQARWFSRDCLADCIQGAWGCPVVAITFEERPSSCP